MKYFTPELYQQFNSFKVEEAEFADNAWDIAETAYRERLTSIREYMPSQVVNLSDLCLHDALVLSRGEQGQPIGEFRSHDAPFLLSPLSTTVAIISATLGEEIVTLIYCLSDHVTLKDAPEGWRFSKLQEEWMYDEVDLLNDRRGPFVHRILLSTGVTLEIPFVSVIIHKFPVPIVLTAAKQSA